MDDSQNIFLEQIHHRLLEGILLRLARLPEAHQFILRGGMLMRLWFRPLLRLANDVDVVATFPFSVDETARRFVPLLSDRGFDDGVILDHERFRAEGIWLHTNFPGVRLFGAGEVDGIEEEFSVDVTFGEPLVPEPELGEYPMLGCGLTASLWMCRPETILGRKLHALLQMGRRHWRPKDINDIRLLLRHMPMNLDDLTAAIEVSFTSRGDTIDDARSLFRQHSWWTTKTSAARWHDFVRTSNDQEVPPDLLGVVANISERLDPILEQLP
ncbi:MAG: nucleotidyl transferase AbiEii/AbiGii toxin family protein [Gemmataceae bacterium]